MKYTDGKIIYNHENKEWVIIELAPHVTSRLKAIFPRIKITSKPPFFFPDNSEIADDLMWFMQKYPLEISDADQNLLTLKQYKYKQKLKRFEDIVANDYKPKDIFLKNNMKLRDYQLQACELAYRNKFLLLGDDLGLGKTVSGIGLLTKKSVLPAIIVVPTHLMSHWYEKIIEFTNLTVHKIKGIQPYQLPSKDVFIIKYSCLTGWFDTFSELKYNTVIFDEVHALRRSQSLRYEAAEELVQYAEYKLGLSASPIFNYGNEIFNILDVLAKGTLGEKEDFLREWTSSDKVVDNPAALGSFLRKNFYFLRRTPEDVGRELPAINKVVQNIDFDQKTVKDAEDLMKALAQKVISGESLERGQAAYQLNTLVRKITGISKAKAVAQYVRILAMNGRKVLLTGWHRQCYDIWMEELEDLNPVLYTGSESTKEKDLSKNKFISGESKVLIMSLRSGEGVDGLQFDCKDVVFGELDWSPAVHDQVIGRINRDGQQSQVTAHYLVSDSGSDPLMIELLGLKASQAKDIVDPNSPIKKQVSNTKHLKELATRILKKK